MAASSKKTSRALQDLKKAGNKSYRRFCFTVWPHKVEDLNWTMPTELPACTRLIAYQTERCPNTNKKHYQGYIAFTESVKWRMVRTICFVLTWYTTNKSLFRLYQVLKTLNLEVGKNDENKGACHVSVCAGNEKQNLAYVGKEESREPGTSGVVLGEPELSDKSGQGKRNELKEATANFLRNGYAGLVRDTPHMLVKFPRGFDNLEARMGKPRDRYVAPKVFILFGPTRCGKTMLAHDLIEKSGLHAFNKNTQTKWWDNYRGQPIVLFDEFVGGIKGGVGLGDLLLITDRYPMDIEVKGGSRVLGASVFVFTSNTNPMRWFSDASAEHQAAWAARITGIMEYSEFDKEVCKFESLKSN